MVLVFAILAAYGLLVPLSRPVTTDFVSFYAAGRLAIGADPTLVYNQAAHYLAEQSVRVPGIAYIHFFYPPVFLIVCGALARLPYLVAFLLFETVSTVLCLLAAFLIGGRRWLMPAISFSPLLWNVALGQNACLTAALFGLGTWLLRKKRPVLAGLVLGCLCYKPHTGLLIPIALAAGRQWRTFLAATACVCFLGLVTLGLFGAGIWQSFLIELARARAEFAAGQIVSFTATASVYGAFRLLDIDQSGASTLEYCVGVLVVCGVIWSWRQPDEGSRYAVLIAGTLLVMPVVLFYDLVMLLIAACWITHSTSLATRANAFGVGFIWVAGLLCYPVTCMTHLPIGATSAALLFCLALRHQARVSARLRKSNSLEPGYLMSTRGIS